jgi:hypothetical protein
MKAAKGGNPMEKLSRRESMKLSATAVAALSLARTVTSSPAAAQGQTAAPQSDSLVETRLRNIAALPLNSDGSAIEHSNAEIGTLDGVLWKTKGTPDIEFDFQKMK